MLRSYVSTLGYNNQMTAYVITENILETHSRNEPAPQHNVATNPNEIRVTDDKKIYAKDGEELKYHILHQRVVVLARRGSRARLIFFLPYKLVPCGAPPPIISRAEYAHDRTPGTQENKATQVRNLYSWVVIITEEEQ